MEFGLESSSLRRIQLSRHNYSLQIFFSGPLFVFGKSLPCDEVEGPSRAVAFFMSCAVCTPRLTTVLKEGPGNHGAEKLSDWPVAHITLESEASFKICSFLALRH